MDPRRAFVWIWLCLALALPAYAREAPVEYRLAPIVEDGRLSALAVTLRFHGAASGVTPLQLPEGYGGGREGWRNVRDLRIEGATSVETPEPGQRIVHAPPGAGLAVTYRVVPTYDHDPLIGEASLYRPTIRPTWFHAVGSSLFVRPYAEAEEAAVAVRFDWTDTPGIKFASDLESLDGRSRRGSRRGTLRDIRTCVVIGGGDLRIATAGAARFAVIGDFDVRPQDVATLAERILQAETAFWGDRPTPFLVTMSPLIAPSKLSKTVNGTGRSGGFSTQVTRNVTLEDLAVLFAHENFHTWNATQLGGQGDDGSPGFWFSEGFTDFYHRALLLRSGVISPQAFADLWNDMLIAYATSPARTLPNAKAAAAFWNDPFAERLPYQRGAMLAAIWDARLRASSGGRRSLDDVMRAQRRSAAQSPGTPAYRLFPKVAAGFGLDVRGDLARYVDAGEPIELPADTFGPCARVRWREQASYDRGWDTAATSSAGGVVTGLRDDSAAYRAGVRNGMLLTGRSFDHSGDSTADFAVRTRSGDGTEREFRFKPEGRDRIAVQHVEPTPGGCAASRP